MVLGAPGSESVFPTRLVLSVALLTGLLVLVLGLAALFVYQVRRFRRSAAVVPELYESQSPAMPGGLSCDETARAPWVTTSTPAELASGHCH